MANKSKAKNRQLDMLVFGRVQGVGFRWTTRKRAQENDLKGSVMNLEDGTVKAIIQGQEDKLKDFLSWVKTSPGFSKVKGIRYSFDDIDKEHEDFKIEYKYSLFKDKSRSFINLSKSFFE